MQTVKYSNEELLGIIDNEGFYYYFTNYGPAAPEDLADESLRELWAYCIAMALDLHEVEQKIMKHLEANSGD